MEHVLSKACVQTVMVQGHHIRNKQSMQFHSTVLCTGLVEQFVAHGAGKPLFCAMGHMHLLPHMDAAWLLVLLCCIFLGLGTFPLLFLFSFYKLEMFLTD